MSPGLFVGESCRRRPDAGRSAAGRFFCLFVCLFSALVEIVIERAKSEKKVKKSVEKKSEHRAAVMLPT